MYACRAFPLHQVDLLRVHAGHVPLGAVDLSPTHPGWSQVPGMDPPGVGEESGAVAALGGLGAWMAAQMGKEG